MDYTGPERRKYLRVPATVPVNYLAIGTTRDYVRSYTEDISPGGIRLLLLKKLAIEGLLKLQLELLRNEGGLLLEARIVWIQARMSNNKFPYKAGVEFTNINMNERTYISQCIYLKTDLLNTQFIEK